MKGELGWGDKGMRKKRKYQRGVQGKDRITRENPSSFPWVCPHTRAFLQNEWINMNKAKRDDKRGCFGHEKQSQAVGSTSPKQRCKATVKKVFCSEQDKASNVV